jgi:hypothetical protein
MVIGLVAMAVWQVLEIFTVHRHLERAASAVLSLSGLERREGAARPEHVERGHPADGQSHKSHVETGADGRYGGLPLVGVIEAELGQDS